MPTVPKGFRYAGINAGIKAARRDLALIVSEVPCAAAGCFTVNKASASPVRIAARRLPASGISAIVANSGNANALTGPDGEQDALCVQRAVASALGVAESGVLSASTGVIGVPLPTAKLEAAAPRLVSDLASALESAAEAVMTTDTRPKIARRVLRLGDCEVRIAAFAKGSGMIAPQMATMLAFITTDAAATPKALQSALGFATNKSFNRLVVDGDMSTNDSVFLLANGLAGNATIDDESSPDFSTFRDALADLCIELARAIAEDGEGATKLVEVNVRGAPTDDIARDLATSIAGSSLVKAAIFGADPNWGRVVATIGARVGSQRYAVDPDKSRVTIQGTLVYDDRGPAKHDTVALRKRMREPRVVIDVRLAEGACESVAWGCDLSYDYVKINADYTSLITASPDGTVTKDDRLTNYSPGFKRALLVEALSYIARFSGRRAVLAYGGGANDSLLASFARDINLLRSAGLLPIVVHGGRDFLHLLDSSRDVAAQARENADPRKMEMVLTGRINTELVSLLNHASAHPAEGEGRARENAAAIGLSGKDAGLFRTKRGATSILINTDVLEMMLPKYVPVLSPVALGEDGESVLLDSDALASDVAVALKADKLIYLADAPGLLEQGELVTEVGANDLRTRLATEGAVPEGNMRTKLAAGLRALEGGVRSVHVIDGRVPHSVIAELFTDTGVGTLLRAD